MTSDLKNQVKLTGVLRKSILKESLSTVRSDTSEENPRNRKVNFDQPSIT